MWSTICGKIRGRLAACWSTCTLCCVDCWRQKVVNFLYWYNRESRRSTMSFHDSRSPYSTTYESRLPSVIKVCKKSHPFSYQFLCVLFEQIRNRNCYIAWDNIIPHFWPHIILQKLEEQHLQSDEKTSHNGKAYVPSKIRDIVTKSISSSEQKMSTTTGTLSDEKRALENEVGRLEDLLSSTRAERDEISSKYLAVSERVSKQYLNVSISQAERLVYFEGVSIVLCTCLLSHLPSFPLNLFQYQYDPSSLLITN